MRFFDILFLIFSCVYLSYSDDSNHVNYLQRTIFDDVTTEQSNVIIDHPSVQQLITSKKSMYIGGDQLKKQFEPFWLRWDNLNVSRECFGSLKKFVRAFDSWETWAIQMADSTGKFPPGILDGAMMDLGSYDQCLRILVNERDKVEFKGKFCMVGHTFDPYSSMNEIGEDGRTYIEIYGEPPDWISNTLKQKSFFISEGDNSFWFGLCLPSTCSNQDVYGMFYSASREVDAKIEVHPCETDDNIKWPLSAKMSLCVLACIALLCVVGSVLDDTSSEISTDKLSTPALKCVQNSEGTLRTVLKSFSVQKNVKRLLREADENSIKCIDGIRVLCSVCVVFVHGVGVYNTKWRLQQFSHDVTAYMATNHFAETIIKSAELMVTWFIFINGFMIIYCSWETILASKRKAMIFLGLFYKYLKIMPVFLFVMSLHFIAPLLYNGPLWRGTWDQEIKFCLNNWWRHILLINNFGSPEKECMAQTWYVAVMFQLNFIAIALVIIACRSRLGSLIIGFILTLCCVIRDFNAIYGIDVYPSIRKFKTKKKFYIYINGIHTQMFIYVGPLMIGLLTGYLVLKYNKAEIKKSYRIAAWIMSTAVMIIVTIFPQLHHTNNLAAFATYVALHKIFYTMAFAWYIYACTTGIGGCINSFLSASCWTVLSRLSFLVYLMHTLIYLAKVAAMRERMVFSQFQLVFDCSALIFITFFFSFLVHIFVEAPVGNLVGVFARALSTQKSEKETLKKSD